MTSNIESVYIETSLVFRRNSPKHLGLILRNIASSDVDQLLAGTFITNIDKVEAYILQIAKKQHWIWIFIHQGHFFRKIPATSARFVLNIKMFQPKY